MNLHPDTPPTLDSMPVLPPRIESALAHTAEPHIPAGFTATVAARVAALPPPRRRVTSPRFGATLAWSSVVLLSVALFVLASHSIPSFTNFRFDAELAVLAELAAVAWMIARGFGARTSR